MAMSSPPRDWRVDEELAEEQERGRLGGARGGASGSSPLSVGTVRSEEYLAEGLGGGEARWQPIERKGVGRVQRSYPGTKSSENGTETGVGLDLAEFSRRK